MDPKYQHYFAKIKDIYLELPDFSFFHSPSGRFRDNPKMVGRKRIRRKLYGLLTNSETKTGSYIITGFRGVGKTSLVNQVINQLQPRSVVFKQALAVLITWVVLHLFFLIFQIYWIWAIALPLVVGLIYMSNSFVNSVLRWTATSYHRQERKKKFMDKKEYKKRKMELGEKRWGRFFGKLQRRLFSFFILDFNYYKMSYADKIAFLFCYAGIIEFGVNLLIHPDGIRGFVLLLLLLLLSSIGMSYRYLHLIVLGKGVNFNNLWVILCLVAMVLSSIFLGIGSQYLSFLNGLEVGIDILSLSFVFLTILVLSFINKWIVERIYERKAKLRRLEVEGLTNMIKQKLNHSHKIFVRLSFPQEAITSKDILKSLVQNMHKELQRYVGFNRVLSRIVFGLLIWFTASIIYQKSFIADVAMGLKTNTDIALYLPSQASHLNQSGHEKMVNHINTLKRLETNKQLRGSIPTSLDIYKKYLGFDEFKTTGLTNKQREVLVIMDYYVYRVYHYSWKFVKPISDIKFWSTRYSLLPPFPDLTYFIWLFTVFGFWNTLLLAGPKMGIFNVRYVKKMLRELNERCLAETELGRESSFVVPIARAGSSFSLRRSKNLKYPIASARDIENDLIRIFDELDRIPKIFAPPEFNFVFDELDKVDPSMFTDKREEGQGEGSPSESEKVRRKRELVSSIMASMKIFFTTAKAKFIFIAGREMYDASLADSSDRESYLGSIFHEIIYVSSLYKDPFDDHSQRARKPIDITYWTERYVCGLLIPDRANYAHNLTGYGEYVHGLQKKQEELLGEFLMSDQRRKILNMVSVFIQYLAYRSKGSPMNLVKLFENFAEEFPHREDDIFDDPEKLIVGSRNPKSFYLTFDFHAQYRISLVAGIFRPFVLESGMHLKKYSDKILVSTSYLLDHIHKFHEFGFSWRNLELLPEIIDINRAPLLRRHIENVVDFLSDSSVKKVENGFVNFKFHRKVIEEVNYLSRSSDTESAIFNFTLDESNAIKSHYRERLRRLNKDYDRFAGDKIRFINSISFLESILGDLHFFDKEYDEAILHYGDAVQGLKKTEDSNELSLHQTLIYTRTVLKEALVFERMNTYEPALTKYSELVEIIRTNGRQLKKIGDGDEYERKYGGKGFYLNTDNASSRSDFHFAKSMYENFSMMLLPILAKLVAIEKISKQGITLKDSLRSDRDFHSVFDYLKKDEKYLLKVEYHLQKGDLLYYKNGILYRDYDEANKVTEQFGYPGKPHMDFNAPYSAYREYITGLALILKKLNSAFNKDLVVDDASLDNPPTGSAFGKILEIEKYSLFTWMVDISIAGKDGVAFEIELIQGFLKFLKSGNVNTSELNITHNAWNLAARLLSALGDCLIVMCHQPSLDFFKDDINRAFNPFEEKAFEKLMSAKADNITRTELAMVYYSASAICYQRANEVRSYAFQHKKILFTVKAFHRFFKAEKSANVAHQLLASLGKKIIEPSNKNRSFIIFPEHSKSNDLRVVSSKETANVIDQLLRYYKFSYNTEVKMSILHWYNVLISDFTNTDLWKMRKKCILQLLNEIPVNAYNTVNDQMVRMFELRFKSRLNRKILYGECLPEDCAKAYYDKIPKKRNENDSLDLGENLDQELMEMSSPLWLMKIIGEYGYNHDHIKFLIFDSIFCELRVIETIDLNNISYIRGYFYQASAYLSLGWWIELWHQFLPENRESFEYKKEKQDLLEHIGSHEIHYVDNAEYAYQQALTGFYNCINMHSEGNTYKSILGNMYFSEGDFNDDNQHFCAAMDRWLINNKVIRRRIEFLKNKLKEDSIFVAETRS